MRVAADSAFGTESSALVNGLDTEFIGSHAAADRLTAQRALLTNSAFGCAGATGVLRTDWSDSPHNIAADSE
jgi:hypothetical protein